MKKLMYKVTNLQTGALVMFERKTDADQYIKLMDIVGTYASLSKWTWEITLED